MKKINLLSEKEVSLLCDAEILYLKNAALEKIKALLQGLQKQISSSQSLTQLESLSQTQFSSSKISKGENYKGLPYLVLDYPAQFSTPSIFAFRSLFWWGNFFSFTLHLQGEVLEKFRSQIILHAPQMRQNEYFICINETPWEYHYEPSNYKNANDFEVEELMELLSQKSFLKLSKKIPIPQYSKLEEKGLEVFSELISFLES